MEGVLVIGTVGVSAKDQLVLRAMLRLLEGGINIRLRYSDQVRECDVVFVPKSNPVQEPMPRSCVLVHIDETAPATETDSESLVVRPPLRLTNVLGVLQRAVQRVHSNGTYDTVQGMRMMFDFLCERLRNTERRRTVLPLTGGQQIVLDYTSQQVYTSLTLPELLSGAYQVGKARRVSPVEEELIRSSSALHLRDLVWGLQARLGEQGIAPSTPLRASYRLRRWPDTMALSRPGVPKLVALMVKQPLTVERASQLSGMPEHEVQGFLQACLALDVAKEVDAVPVEPPKPASEAQSAMPQWLKQLRKHLRLW